MNDFYVYVYLKEDNKTPYYVGKGKGQRAFYHHKGVQAPPRERIKFLYENLTELDALDKEITTIKELGRLDLGTGPLENKCNGGAGSRGRKGKPLSEETKRKISEANKLTKRRGVSEETRRKMSEAAKKRCTPEWREGRRKHMQKLNEKLTRDGTRHTFKNRDPKTGRFST